MFPKLQTLEATILMSNPHQLRIQRTGRQGLVALTVKAIREPTRTYAVSMTFDIRADAATLDTVVFHLGQSPPMFSIARWHALDFPQLVKLHIKFASSNIMITALHDLTERFSVHKPCLRGFAVYLSHSSDPGQNQIATAFSALETFFESFAGLKYVHIFSDSVGRDALFDVSCLKRHASSLQRLILDIDNDASNEGITHTEIDATLPNTPSLPSMSRLSQLGFRLPDNSKDKVTAYVRSALDNLHVTSALDALCLYLPVFWDLSGVLPQLTDFHGEDLGALATEIYRLLLARRSTPSNRLPVLRIDQDCFLPEVYDDKEDLPSTYAVPTEIHLVKYIRNDADIVDIEDAFWIDKDT